MSMRALAAGVAVSPSFLSRLLRGVEYKVRPSSDLAARIARAFQLPDDFFLEYREQRISELIRNDPDLCDRVYKMLSREGKL